MGSGRSGGRRTRTASGRFSVSKYREEDGEDLERIGKYRDDARRRRGPGTYREDFLSRSTGKMIEDDEDPERIGRIVYVEVPGDLTLRTENHEEHWARDSPGMSADHMANVYLVSLVRVARSNRNAWEVDDMWVFPPCRRLARTGPGNEFNWRRCQWGAGLICTSMRK